MTLLLYGTLGSAHCEWSASSAPALQRYVDARCNDARCKGQQWCEMNGVLQQVDCCCTGTVPDSSSRVRSMLRAYVNLRYVAGKLRIWLGPEHPSSRVLCMILPRKEDGGHIEGKKTLRTESLLNKMAVARIRWFLQVITCS